MSLGLRLQTAREKLGLTEEMVAKAANMRVRYYVSIEDDEIERPTPMTLQKLADALSVSMDYLLGNEKDVETLKDALPEPYFKFVSLVMRLVVVLGVLALVACFVILSTLCVRAISNVIGDMSQQTANQGYLSEPISTLVSTQAYTGSQIPLHLQPQICLPDSK